MPFFKLKYWLLAGMLLPLVLLTLALIAPNGPAYSVVERGDGFQLRRYAPFIVAETTVPGAFADADNAAYPLLLDYIRGRNSGGRKVPMMAPVMQQAAAAADGERGWRVQFVMPREYPLGMLPAPADAAVALRPQPERLVAAVRFGGGWQEARWQEHAAELLNALARAGRASVGEPVFARYNAAFVPGLLRRNEVLVAVEP
jgi:hypothetical protein